MSYHRRVVVAYPHAPPGTCKHCGKPTGDRSRAHAWCAAKFAESARYRQAAEKREGKVQRCVRCRKRAGDWAYDPKAGKLVQLRIERDHVASLALFGRHDWTVPRCQLCHREKSTQDNRKAKAVRTERRDRLARRHGRQRGKTMSTSTRDRGHRPVAAAVAQTLVGTLFVVVAGGWLTSDLWLADARVWWRAHDVAVAGWGVAASVAIIAALVVFTRLRLRRRHRDDALYRLRYLLAKETHTDPSEVRVKATRWVHHVPVAGQAWYSEVFDDDNETERERVESRIEHKLGVNLAFRWTPAGDTVRWQPADKQAANMPGDIPAQPDTSGDSDRQAAIRERVEGAVRATIKGEVTVDWGRADAVGPVAFTLTYPSAYNDESDDVRQGLVDRVNAKAPGRWRATWDTEQNEVRFERRPAMPADVPIPVRTDGDTWRLPFGVNEHGDEVAWELRHSPHMLVAGGTGSGKTVTLRALVQAAVARGFVVFAVDPKRIEMAGLRDWPGVRVVATEITDMIALVTMLADEMDARYAAIEAGETDEDRLEPVLVVIDEAAEWVKRCNAWWKANKQTGMTGTEHPVVERWRSMARLGRSGRMHLLVGIQRPDAKLFGEGGGEARDNYGYRVALGPMSEQGARMVFGRTDVGRDIPRDAKGRGTVGIGEDRALEVQTYNSPDPRRHGADTDNRLAALRDLAAKHASPALPYITGRAVAMRAAEMAQDPAGREQASAKRTRRARSPAPPPPPEPSPWVSVDPATLMEGQRVRIEVDGELTEVEVTSLCEDPREPEVTEVEWRAANGREGVQAFNPGETVEYHRPAAPTR